MRRVISSTYVPKSSAMSGCAQTNHSRAKSCSGPDKARPSCRKQAPLRLCFQVREHVINQTSSSGQIRSIFLFADTEGLREYIDTSFRHWNNRAAVLNDRGEWLRFEGPETPGPEKPGLCCSCIERGRADGDFMGYGAAHRGAHRHGLSTGIDGSSPDGQARGRANDSL